MSISDELFSSLCADRQTHRYNADRTKAIPTSFSVADVPGMSTRR